LGYWKTATNLDFKQEGDVIFQIGFHRDDLGSSEYLRTVHNITFSTCPYFDLEEEVLVQQTVRQAIEAGLLQSAHDVSEGGLFVAMLESAMPRGLGLTLRTNVAIRQDAFLFGEAQSRVVVSVHPEQVEAFERFMLESGAPFDHLGTVTGHEVVINEANWGLITAWRDTYNTVLEQLME
jgi:phosphoribosylformylglycinamidine synthase subunit PurL